MCKHIAALRGAYSLCIDVPWNVYTKGRARVLSVSFAFNEPMGQFCYDARVSDCIRNRNSRLMRLSMKKQKKLCAEAMKTAA